MMGWELVVRSHVHVSSSFIPYSPFQKMDATQESKVSGARTKRHIFSPAVHCAELAVYCWTVVVSYKLAVTFDGVIVKNMEKLLILFVERVMTEVEGEPIHPKPIFPN